MAQRRAGETVVGILVVGTVGALGMATVYLPFFADKEKMRGLGEDADREQEKMQRLMIEARKKHMAMKRKEEEEEALAAERRKHSNSMWKNLGWRGQ